tara:strand:- start:387 stop:566 length:180 start_codon:yes stop_codon:yes gene_type:complete
MTKRKYTMYDAEWGDNPPPKKSSKQILSEFVNENIKRIEGKEYRRKKRKIDDIKSLEEE